MQISSSDLAVYRKLMIDRIERDDPDRKAELALSGGIDSCSILFAMLETGRKPQCFTFYIEQTPSEDLYSARALCKHFGLNLREVPLQWDMDQLVIDLKKIVPIAHNARKPTIIQCMHPWLYLYPAMESDLAFCGLGAEDMFCTQGKIQKLMNMSFADAKRKGGDKEACRAAADKAVWDNGYRGKSWSSDLNWSSANIMRLGGMFGKTLIDIYGDYPELTAWFAKHSVYDLHDPTPKAASVYAFRDYFSQGPFLRKPCSYQINSKIKDMHEALCKEERYNVRGCVAPAGLYNDIMMGLL